MGHPDQSDGPDLPGIDSGYGQHFPYRLCETPVPVLGPLLHPAGFGVAGGLFPGCLAGDAGGFIEQHRFTAARTEVAGKDVSVCIKRTH